MPMQSEYSAALESLPRLPFPAETLDIALKTDDISELQKIIVKDTSLTLKILSAANTAAVRRGGREVICVKSALIRIGLIRAKAILMGAMYSKTLDTRLCPSFNARKYWEDAAAIGFAAQGIADVTGHTCENIRGGAMSAGLLSRIGLLFLAHYYPKELNRCFFLYANEEDQWESFGSCVRSVMKVDYDELGSNILNQWNLPKALSVVPGRIRKVAPSAERDIASLVSLANLWARDDFSPESTALNLFSGSQKDRLIKLAPGFARDAEMLSSASS